MAMLRLTTFWRVIGVVHSNLNYMENKDLASNPPTEKSSLLTRKIDMLYNVLTADSVVRPSTLIHPENRAMPSNIMDLYGVESANGPNGELRLLPPNSADEPDAAEEVGSVSLNEPNDNVASSLSSDVSQSTGDSDNDFIGFRPPTEEALDRLRAAVDRQAISPDEQMDHSNYEFESEHTVEPKATHQFVNMRMKLKLPIKMEPTQRVLMIKLGNDFTHIWFPTWRKFLSRNNILQNLEKSASIQMPIRLSFSSTPPSAYVSHTHDQCIFVGPYGPKDTQKLALCVYHESHMIFSSKYKRDHPDPTRTDTKGTYFQLTADAMQF